MGKTYVLDRVAADLARGFTHPAIQRLGSLVAAYPTDLDLRRRLAAVHRRVGNRVQAGRWDYLTIGADAGDTLAFERAFPSPVARLREVRWPYRASSAATAYARTRLERLVAAAEAERTAVLAVRATRPAPRVAEPRIRGAMTGMRRSVSRWLPTVVQSRLPARTPRLPRTAVAAAAATAAVFAAIGAGTVVEWIVR